MLTITISGEHGSGKTTLAQKISKHFNLSYFSAGASFREMAKRRGYTLKEFTDLAKVEPSIDIQIDEQTKSIAKKGSTIIDSQLGAFMVPRIQSPSSTLIKFCILSSQTVRYQRISERENISLNKARILTERREEAELARFQALYNFDLTDYSIYDFILNSANFSKETLFHIVENIIVAIISS